MPRLKLTTKSAPRVVKEVPWGVYVWEMPDGRWVGDENGNFLSIDSTEGNLAKIRELTSAVRSYGVEEGRPLFLTGRRKVDDEEYEKQKFRMALGMVPDEWDLPAMIEAQKFANDKNV